VFLTQRRTVRYEIQKERCNITSKKRHLIRSKQERGSQQRRHSGRRTELSVLWNASLCVMFGSSCFL